MNSPEYVFNASVFLAPECSYDVKCGDGRECEIRDDSSYRCAPGRDEYVGLTQLISAEFIKFFK